LDLVQPCEVTTVDLSVITPSGPICMGVSHPNYFKPPRLDYTISLR